jgi:uncharacterized protein with FMN-binding domain
MRKIALSLFVIAASGAYVLHQRAGGDPLLDGGLQADAAAPATLAVKPRMAVSIDAPTALPRPAPVAPPAPPEPPASVAANTLQPVDPLPQAPADPPPQPVDPAPVAAIPAPSAPIPTLRPTPAPPVVQVKNDPPALPKGQYRDGTYPGPTVDAYYGLVQVQAVVQGGKLVSVDVLQYPADRRTSRAINHQALPMLQEEVLQAQSARVDIISGATLTSSAYRRSLGRALAAAS